MNEQPMDNTENREELNELMRVRRDKLKDLYDLGIDPFGEKFERTHTAQEIIDRFD